MIAKPVRPSFFGVKGFAIMGNSPGIAIGARTGHLNWLSGCTSIFGDAAPVVAAAGTL